MSSNYEAEKDFISYNKGFIEAITKNLSNAMGVPKEYISTYDGSSKPNVLIWGEDPMWVTYNVKFYKPEYASISFNNKTPDPYKDLLDAFLKEQEVFTLLYAEKVKKFMGEK